MYGWWMRGGLRDAEGKEKAGDGTPAVDVAALRIEITRGVLAELKPVLEGLKPKVEERRDEEDPAGEGKKPDPALREMRNEIKKLREQAEQEKAARAETEKRAEERERHAAIRSLLGNFQFASDKARDSAFKILRDEVKRGEDGKLYGPDGETPYEEFVGRQMEEVHDYLLKAKDVGGAGAMNGGSKRTAVDLNDIKPGMDKDKMAAARAEVARLLKSQHE